MDAFVSIFTGIFTGIALLIVNLHKATGAIFGERSGLSWLFAIILLTVIVRLLLFPIFVKQIKTQRSMQVLQPKIKALQAKHKGDRETLNAELMKLYKEHGANPLAGCLPLLLQAPIFIGMFRVLRGLGPTLVNGTYVYPDGNYGVSRDLAQNLSEAKIFGAPIGAAFTSPTKLLEFLHTGPGAVKAVTLTLIVFMGLTQFVSSKQLMAKNKTAGPVDPQQQMQQRVLLYVMPFMLALFGFSVPLGVLVYWTTSNLWSMGQQALVIKKMPPSQGGTGEPEPAAPKPDPAPADPGVPPKTKAPKQPPPANRSKKKGKGRKGGRR